MASIADLSNASTTSHDPLAGEGVHLPDRGRDRNVASVRGLVCVLLVAYHVVGVDEHAGMHVSAASAWHYVVNSLEFIRMPAFTVLSGLLYARRRMDAGHLSSFWRKKAQHLLVPLVFATIVTWALRRQAYGAGEPLVEALLFHYQHFWYLQALLLVFLVISLWDCLRRPRWEALTLAMFGFAVASRSLEPIAFFSIGGAIYLMPYFIFGMLLREHRGLLMRDDVVTLAIGVVAIVLVAQQGAMSAVLNPLSRLTLAAAACGMAGSLLLLRFVRPVPIAEWIGGCSYTIYLWHSAAAALARELVGPSIGSSPLLLFPIMLASGLGLPIVLHRLVQGWPVVQTLLTGGSARPAPPRGIIPPWARRRR